MLDLIVIGLGVYGASVAAEAGARGLSVLAFEQGARDHNGGSSHGRSRIFRLTTVEGDDLALRARRALDLWKGYDAEADGRILIESGFAIVQAAGAEKQVTHDVTNVVGRAHEVARRQQIAHELLSGVDFNQRFPDFAPLAVHDQVFYEPNAFIILADQALTAIGRRAETSPHVELAYNTPATAVRRKGGYVEVDCAGETVRAKRAVLCTGPWLQRQLLGRDTIPAAVLPQFPMTTTLRSGETFPRFPAFVHVRPAAPTLYGLPASNQLPEVKFGIEQNSEVPEPGLTHLPGNFVATSREATLAAIGASVPTLTDRDYVGDLCHYTKTPDSRPVVQHLGDQREVTVVSACSGHGFKYAPALAEELVGALAN